MVFLNMESVAQIRPRRGVVSSMESGPQVGPRAFRIPRSPMWFVIRSAEADRLQVAIYDELRGVDVALFETTTFAVNRAPSEQGAAVLFPSGVDGQGRTLWTALVGFAGGAIVQASGIPIAAAGAASAFVRNASGRPVFVVFDENDAVVRWAIQVRSNRSMGGGGVSAEQRLPWNEFIDDIGSPANTESSRILERAISRVPALNPNEPALGFVETAVLPPAFRVTGDYKPQLPIEGRVPGLSGRSQYGLSFGLEPPEADVYLQVRETKPSTPGLFLATDVLGRSWYVVDDPGRDYRRACISYFGIR